MPVTSPTLTCEECARQQRCAAASAGSCGAKEEPVKKATTKKPKPKPEPEVLEAFPLKEHAISALSECKTKENMRVWGMRVKVSSLIGQDLEDLREAGKHHLLEITKGGGA